MKLLTRLLIDKWKHRNEIIINDNNSLNEQIKTKLDELNLLLNKLQ